MRLTDVRDYLSHKLSMSKLEYRFVPRISNHSRTSLYILVFAPDGGSKKVRISDHKPSPSLVTDDIDFHLTKPSCYQVDVLLGKILEWLGDHQKKDRNSVIGR